MAKDEITDRRIIGPASTPPEEPEGITLACFLAEHPPGSEKQLKYALSEIRSTGVYNLSFPDIRLHCPSCGEQHRFEFKEDCPQHGNVKPGATRWVFLDYACVDCQSNHKTFALFLRFPKRSRVGGNPSCDCFALKIGEWPPFGLSTPADLVDILGATNEPLFSKGLRAESQSMGIGASAYYRRIVENTKNKLFDEIIAVAKAEGSLENLIQELESAKKEKQFTASVERIKSGLPKSLLIDGKNPLTYLHKILSQDLHNRSEEQCLEDAENIKIVLVALVERMAELLKDPSKVTDAMRKIEKSMNPQQQK